MSLKGSFATHQSFLCREKFRTSSRKPPCGQSRYSGRAATRGTLGCQKYWYGVDETGPSPVLFASAPLGLNFHHLCINRDAKKKSGCHSRALQSACLNQHVPSLGFVAGYNRTTERCGVGEDVIFFGGGGENRSSLGIKSENVLRAEPAF